MRVRKAAKYIKRVHAETLRMTIEELEEHVARKCDPKWCMCVGLIERRSHKYWMKQARKGNLPKALCIHNANSMALFWDSMESFWNVEFE